MVRLNLDVWYNLNKTVLGKTLVIDFTGVKLRKVRSVWEIGGVLNNVLPDSK